MEEIIIERIENQICIYVFENKELVEEYHYEDNKNSTIGNIYVGTVSEILNGMEAAFVNVGLEKKGFLPLKDAIEKVDLTKIGSLNESKVQETSKEDEKTQKLKVKNSEIKISEVLQKNQNLLVQVRKEAVEDKGARISTHITLAGNYIVLMPNTEIVTLSQKIINTSERNRLIGLAKSNLPKNFGCVIRTNAEGISEEEISKDLNEVLNEWQEIENKFKKLNKSELNDSERLIYNDNSIATKVARDMVKKTTKKIYVNDKTIYDELNKKLKDNKILEYEDTDFINKFGLESELEKAENRKIWLKSGGQIVIDKAEALTAIDVNTGKYVGTKDLETTIFKINKEAAIEIMKQLRLKDIGGIIVIDYIDMNSEENKNEILNIMKEEQKKDRSKIEIKNFTELNLVEMTRKKLHV